MPHHLQAFHLYDYHQQKFPLTKNSILLFRTTGKKDLNSESLDSVQSKSARMLAPVPFF